MVGTPAAAVDPAKSIAGCGGAAAARGVRLTADCASRFPASRRRIGPADLCGRHTGGDNGTGEGQAGGQPLNWQGRRLTPLTKLDRRRSGSPAVMSGTRVSSSRSITVSSRRARGAPRQEGGPAPPEPGGGVGEGG